MRVPNLKFWSPRQRGGWKLVVHQAVEKLKGKKINLKTVAEAAQKKVKEKAEAED